PHVALNITPPLSRLHRALFSPDTPAPQTYTLSLHDALPIFHGDPDLIVLDAAPAHPSLPEIVDALPAHPREALRNDDRGEAGSRSEEHTSELQSLTNLVCRLLLEKKKRQAQDIDASNTDPPH